MSYVMHESYLIFIVTWLTADFPQQLVELDNRFSLCYLGLYVCLRVVVSRPWSADKFDEIDNFDHFDSKSDNFGFQPRLTCPPFIFFWNKYFAHNSGCEGTHYWETLGWCKAKRVCGCRKNKRPKPRWLVWEQKPKPFRCTQARISFFWWRFQNILHWSAWW